MATYAASQLVSFVAGGFVGYPHPLPIHMRSRFVAVTDPAGTVLTSNNLDVGFQFEIGL
jgi:hypothetical protein